MSRWLARGVSVGAGFAIAAAPMPAQDIAQLRARIVASERAFRVAADSHRARLNALRADAPAKDSIRAGGLVIESRTGLSTLTRRTLQRAADRAWNTVRHALGDSADAVTRNLPLLFGQDSSGGMLSPRRAHLWIPRVPGRGTPMRLPLSETVLSDAMIDRVGSLASLRNPPALRVWIGDWMPPRRFTRDDWGDVAIMLATANAEVTRGCHAGAVSQCLSALSLVAVNDSLTEWYAPADWVVLARTYSIAAHEPWPNAHRDCVEHRDAAVCLRILRTRAAPQPIPVDVRRSLVAYALERGGSQAFARLMTASGTPLENLRRTSGLSTDSLIAGWRATVIAATPQAVRPDTAEGALMIGWALLFGVAATRRRP